MVNKQTKNTIITVVATAIIAGLLSPLIISYLNSSDPVFYLEDSNNYGFNKDKEDTLTLNLNNRGNVPGFATVCAFSKEFVFIADSGDFVHQICFPENKISSIQTSLMYPYALTVKPDANIFNSIQNATIRVDVTCHQEIWSLLRKNCDGLTRAYNYKKEGDRLNKIY